MSPSSEKLRGLDRTGLLPRVVFLGCFAYFLWAAGVGWNNTLLDDHGFRQTQTAISTYYMIGRPPTLAYETPVLGPPWSIPFEFPLYQWTVAALVGLWHTPLEQTGRLVSVAFFLLGLIPAYRILAELNLAKENRLIVLSLLLISPFYIFWSRTFMIESTAFFFSLCFLACAMRLRHSGSYWIAMAAAVTGTLAALVKITTWAPFLLAALVAWCDVLVRARTARRALRVRSALLYAAVTAVPIGLATIWTSCAEEARNLNQFGRFTSSTALKDWIYGTWEQRLAVETWSAIGSRFGLLIGHAALGLVCLVGLWLSGRRWLSAAICFALGLSAPAIFTNLHFVHEYYAYANGVFLIAGFGLSLTAMIERGGGLRRGGLYILATLIAANLFRYQQDYYPKQSANHLETVRIADAVQRVTHRDDVLVILGCDWSPEIPYYSGRRALMIPAWKTISMQSLAEYMEPLKGYSAGALIVRSSPEAAIVDPSLLRQILAELGLDAHWVSLGDGYRLYPRKESVET